MASRAVKWTMVVVLVGISLSGRDVWAQSKSQDARELAKKLSNPISSLISVPFQYNYDTNIGPQDDGDRSTLNIQPVVPFALNRDWNLVSRTIVPVVAQEDTFPGSGDQQGLGDITQSLFFSPKEPSDGGWIWGAGPVFVLPTATDDLLGKEQWGVGPTGVALKQHGPWTYGALVNHVISFAGSNDREDLNATFLQPFLSYTTPTAVTYGVNFEATYDWEADASSIPINFQVNKVTTIGEQIVQYGGGVRYWVESPEGGPEDFGLRLNFVLLFPR